MSNLKNELAKKANNSVTDNKNKEPQTIKDWIKVMEPAIKKALPSVITAERFSRIALTAISVNPKLAECTPQSFIGALMNAAQLGLEPNTPLGQAYLIPFDNNRKINGEYVKISEVQFQIGYKGLIELAYRSGEFTNIYAKEVFENDEFEYEFGLEPVLKHKPASGNRGEVIAYYAVFKLTNGGFGFEVMSKSDIENHAKKYSKSFGNDKTPWSKNYDEMAKKTVLKKVLKYAPIKAEFAKQVVQDTTITTVKTVVGEDIEIENQNVFEVEETDYEVIDQEVTK